MWDAARCRAAEGFQDETCSVTDCQTLSWWAAFEHLAAVALLVRLSPWSSYDRHSGLSVVYGHCDICWNSTCALWEEIYPVGGWSVKRPGRTYCISPHSRFNMSRTGDNTCGGKTVLTLVICVLDKRKIKIPVRFKLREDSCSCSSNVVDLLPHKFLLLLRHQLLNKLLSAWEMVSTALTNASVQ